MPTGKTTDAIAMNFFQTLSFYYTYTVLKDIQVGRCRTMIRIAVNSSDFRKSMLILLKMICNI